MIKYLAFFLFSGKLEVIGGVICGFNMFIIDYLLRTVELGTWGACGHF